MITLYRDILCFFHIIDALKNCQAMADTGHSHSLEVIVQQGKVIKRRQRLDYIERQGEEEQRMTDSELNVSVL